MLKINEKIDQEKLIERINISSFIDMNKIPINIVIAGDMISDEKTFMQSTRY